MWLQKPYTRILFWHDINFGCFSLLLWWRKCCFFWGIQIKMFWVFQDDKTWKNTQKTQQNYSSVNTYHVVEFKQQRAFRSSTQSEHLWKYEQQKCFKLYIITGKRDILSKAISILLFQALPHWIRKLAKSLS